MLNDLYTVRGENLTGTPWTVYPRPQMKRDSYVNLNGEWEFSTNYGEPEGVKTIQVPFCPESRLSGVNHHFPEGAALTYRRVVKLPEGFNRGRVLLHIGAADQSATVFVNKKRLCEHSGGYEAFCVDITEALREENEIVIVCTDDLRNPSFPYGKQVLPEKRGGMWYTPVSGIWQTVWRESVPETYIEKLKIENRGYSVTISTVPALDGKVTVAGLGEYALKNGIKLTEFLPEYELYGRAAPIVRNKKIAEHADAALVFWDGSSKGTDHTVKLFQKLGKNVTVITL